VTETADKSATETAAVTETAKTVAARSAAADVTTTDFTAAGGTAAGAGGGADSASLIADKRQRIDDLDARIIALVGERMAVSGDIQAARIGSGGRRLHLTREMEVLRTYGEALGKSGTALAMTLLELCRGRV
jgi:chorismate mutase